MLGFNSKNDGTQITTYLLGTEKAAEEALRGLGFVGTFGAFWSGDLLIGLT